METSASCEELMKEEVADSSKQGMQINSWLDTSLSDANTMSLSRVPVEMEISASKNNDLEIVLMHDQPVEKKAKRPDASCEETVVVEAKIGGLEQQLNEALRSAESRSGSVPDSNLEAAEDNVDSSAVLKKLVEELLKIDAVSHQLDD